MKKFRILMGTLALAVVAATVIACTKDKETKVAQQATETEEVARKPIATYDNATGQMTYHVSVEQLQTAMDDYSLTKNDDEYVVESWQILEDDTSGLPYLKFVLLNIQDESSLSIYLFDHFVEKQEVNDGIEFKLSEDVVSGDYYYFISPKAGEYYVVTVKNGDEITIEPWNEKDAKAMPGGSKTVLTCHSQGCEDPITECRVAEVLGIKICTPCAKPGQCNWSESTAVTSELINAM